MQVQRKALVGGKRQRHTVECLAGLHERESQPRVGAWHKLAVELEVYSCGIAVAQVLSIVSNLHIINIIRYEVVETLVICLGGELKLP